MKSVKLAWNNEWPAAAKGNMDTSCMPEFHLPQHSTSFLPLTCLRLQSHLRVIASLPVLWDCSCTSSLLFCAVTINTCRDKMCHPCWKAYNYWPNSLSIFTCGAVLPLWSTSFHTAVFYEPPVNLLVNIMDHLAQCFCKLVLTKPELKVSFTYTDTKKCLLSTKLAFGFIMNHHLKCNNILP